MDKKLLGLIVKELSDMDNNPIIENRETEDFGVGEFVIIRTYSAGVFAGILKFRKNKEAIIVDCRRLWSWSGAASLSQMANEGVKKPSSCKFAVKVEKEIVIGVIEIIPCTSQAKDSILSVPEWKA